MKPIQPLFVAIIAVAVGAAAFFGGMQYQKMQAMNAAGGSGRQGSGGQGQGGAGGRARGAGGMGGRVIGEIISQDDKSITVKMMDGSSKIVLLSDSTTVSKTSDGSKTDLKVGEKVGVFGTDNSDGSVTAQNVQLNPAFSMGMGRGGQSQAGSQSGTPAPAASPSAAK
jgi:hypothetical protein